MAAMPLASFLRFDPWTDQVINMTYAREPIINERDKMPFEVEPVYLKLAYYAPPAAPAAPAPAAPAACRGTNGRRPTAERQPPQLKHRRHRLPIQLHRRRLQHQLQQGPSNNDISQ